MKHFGTPHHGGHILKVSRVAWDIEYDICVDSRVHRPQQLNKNMILPSTSTVLNDMCEKRSNTKNRDDRPRVNFKKWFTRPCLKMQMIWKLHALSKYLVEGLTTLNMSVFVDWSQDL